MRLIKKQPLPCSRRDRTDPAVRAFYSYRFVVFSFSLSWSLCFVATHGRLVQTKGRKKDSRFFGFVSPRIAFLMTHMLQYGTALDNTAYNERCEER